MKKSEMYRQLQRTLITEEIQFDYDERLEVLRELFAQEDIARVLEGKEVKTDEAVGD